MKTKPIYTYEKSNKFKINLDVYHVYRRDISDYNILF